MSNIQDLEQEVLRCWEITQDLQLLAGGHEHDNEVCDKVLAIATLYEMRFSKAWNTYEKLVKEHYMENKDG